MGYVILYLAAIIIANLTVAVWGPGVSIINALLFIGLDLTARDRLHDAWHRKGLAWKMAALIASGSALSYALNRNAGSIALASFAAFAAAGTVDVIAYHALRNKPKRVQVNGSNVFAAAVDSVIFPALAFGFPLMWPIMLGQFVAKTVGGYLWSLVLTSPTEA